MARSVILVVCGDPAWRAAVSQLLSHTGHVFAHASSPQEGVSVAQEQLPDLILIDEALPGGKTHSICQQFRSVDRLADIPIAIISRQEASEESIAASLDAGADDYLRWPLTEGELTHRLNLLLRLKHTQDQLHEKRHLYHKLCQTVSSGVATYQVLEDGEKVIFKDLNPAAQRLSKVRLEDAMGRDVRDVFPGVVEMGLFDVLVRVWRTGDPEVLPSVLYKDDRFSHVVENRVFRLTTGDVVAVYDDTTERARVERRLGERDELLQAVFDTDPNCLFVKDQGGRYVLVNRAIANLYSCQPEEMIGRTDAEMAEAGHLGRQDAEAFLHDDLLVIQDGKPKHIPLERFTRADGALHWFKTEKVPLRYGQEKGLMLGIAVDVTDLKRAEDTIRESERRYRTLFETMAQGVFYQHADGTLIDVNDAALRMFGVTREEFLGRTSEHPEWQVIAEDGAPLPAAEHPSMVALTTGKPIRDRVFAVFNPVRQDWVWVTVNASPEFRPGETQPYRVFLTMHDITERKHAEEALRENEMALAEAQRISHLGSWKWDVTRGEVVWSDELYRIFGLAPQSQQPSFELAKGFVHPEDAELWQSHVTAALNGEKPFTMDYRAVRTDGAVRWVRNEANVERDSDGHTILVTGTVQDITDIKRAEQDIKDKNAELETILTAVPDALIFAHTDRRIHQVNPAFTKLFGYRPEEALQKTTRIIYPSDEAYREQGRIRYDADLHGALEPYITQYQRKDHTLFPGETVAARVKNADGEIVGFLALIRDISERMRLESRVLQAQRMEVVGQLAAGIAHDFNNLLTAINGFAELLQLDFPPDDPHRHMADIILESGNRAAFLVKQLLGFARKQATQPHIVNVNETISSLEQRIRQDLGPTVRLELNLLPDLWPTLVDPDQMKQAVLDLTANALRTMPNGGNLKIETRNLCLREPDIEDGPEVVPGDYVAVAFSDTGPVLPSEHKSRIFEPFFFTSREVADGTGLRLASVYGATRQNGGHIHVVSREGVGTRLEIRLPKHDGSVESIAG
jgi:two-component system, cell cycle sensor histidine kinase and response regulator CckA